MDQEHTQPTLEQAASRKAEVDRRCDAFEQRLRTGERPRIEAILQEVGAPCRVDLLRELVALEIAYRQRAGETVQVNNYRARFPDDLDAVDTAWSLVVNRSREDTDVECTIGTTPHEKLDTAESAGLTGRSSQSSMPKQIGRYLIEDELGRGGFGTVYRARDPELKRTVAIKVPHARLAMRMENIQAHLLEAQTLASLDHPHIVPVFDADTAENGRLYIVSRYISGNNLTDALQGRQFTRRETALLVADLADALQYAHAKGVVHRDVKPANILLDASGNARLIDFGLALTDDQYGQGPHIAGTWMYMSPEQVRAEGHRVDGRADIYSLGVVLYQMLSGRVPYRSKQWSSLADEIVHAEIRPARQLNASIPRALDAICMKCLEKDPHYRYACAADLASDLRQWAEDRTSTPRLPFTIAGLATLLVIAVIIVGALLLSGSDTEQPATPPVPATRRSTEANLSDFEIVVRRQSQADNFERRILVRHGEEQPEALEAIGSGDAFRLIATFDRPTYCVWVHVDPNGDYVVVQVDSDATSQSQCPAKRSRMAQLPPESPPGINALVLLETAVRPARTDILQQTLEKELGHPFTPPDVVPQRQGERAGFQTTSDGARLPPDFLRDLSQRLPGSLKVASVFFFESK